MREDLRFERGASGFPPPVGERIVLDLCGGTGAWSLPYVKAGYDVRLVTLPMHDVRTYVPPANVYGILCAPPCTEFAVSGAQWWATKNPALLEEALAIFDACLAIIAGANRAERLAWWALENPVGRLRKLRPQLGPPHLSFDPCDYGDAYTKRTLVWGRFDVPLRNRVQPAGHRPGQPNAWYSKVGGKSAATKAWRSATPPGFARAFFEANQ